MAEVGSFSIAQNSMIGFTGFSNPQRNANGRSVTSERPFLVTAPSAGFKA